MGIACAVKVVSIDLHLMRGRKDTFGWLQKYFQFKKEAPDIPMRVVHALFHVCLYWGRDLKNWSLLTDQGEIPIDAEIAKVLKFVIFGYNRKFPSLPLLCLRPVFNVVVVKKNLFMLVLEFFSSLLPLTV